MKTTLWRALPRPLLVLLATLGLVIAFQAGPAIVPPDGQIGQITIAQLAHAKTSSGRQYFCNSSNSVGPITVHPDVGGQRTIITSYCADVDNSYGHTLVDPDPELSGSDVDSSWWGYIGHGYDYCDPGEGWIDFPNLNPYGSGGPDIRINTDKSGC